MKTKYVCHGPISAHASFLVNRFVGTEKIAGGAKRKKSTIFSMAEQKLVTISTKAVLKHQRGSIFHNKWSNNARMAFLNRISQILLYSALQKM